MGTSEPGPPTPGQRDYTVIIPACLSTAAAAPPLVGGQRPPNPGQEQEGGIGSGATTHDAIGLGGARETHAHRRGPTGAPMLGGLNRANKQKGVSIS